jgi:hypothetical protein
MCSLVPLLTTMLPNASTVPGWQVTQVESVIAGVWLASFGGTP